MTATLRRKALSAIVMAFCAGSVLLALVPLGFVLFFVVSQGIRSINLAFFTHMPLPVGEPGGGMANAIVGTLIVSGLAAAMAVPIGVLSGIYMAEYAGMRLAGLMHFAADMLNGVPSIVIGVFAYVIAVLPFKQFSALAGGAARYRHRHRARAGADRRRNGAAPVHGIQQPVLLAQPQAADLDAHRASVHLRDRSVRRLASAGVGRRPRSRLDRTRVLAARASGDAAPRTHARAQLDSFRFPVAVCASSLGLGSWSVLRPFVLGALPAPWTEAQGPWTDFWTTDGRRTLHKGPRTTCYTDSENAIGYC
jgi:hypothetical protein